MPELSNNFLRGRMNKDLDDRLVPRGEYRDALNIEVSTSESSDVGTVQNTKGNKDIVTNVFEDTFHSNIYSAFGGATMDGTPTTSGTNIINGPISVDSFNELKVDKLQTVQNTDAAPYFSYKSANILELEVGKYYTISFEIEVDPQLYSNGTFQVNAGLVGQSGAYQSTIPQFDELLTFDNNVVTSGDHIQEFIFSFYAQETKIEFYVNKNFSGSIKNIALQDNSNLSSTTDDAVTVGSKEDTSKDIIYNFVHKASNLKTNTSANSQGQSLVRKLGIISDCILAHKPNAAEETAQSYPVFTDVYEVRLVPRVSSTGKLPMMTSNSVPTPTQITGVPLVVNENGAYDIPGVKPGMTVGLIDSNGIDFWSGKDVKVESFSVDYGEEYGIINITNPNNTNLFNTAALESGYLLRFTSPRILNFTSGNKVLENNVEGNPSSYTPIETQISAIDILDDTIYFTDGRNEPKKININRFSTQTIYKHSTFQTLTTSHIAEEHHVTVIKAKPTSPPTLVMSGSVREPGGFISITNEVGDTLIYDGQSVNPSNGNILPIYTYSTETSGVISEANTGNNITFLNGQDEIISAGEIKYIECNIPFINWKEGDILKLTGVVSEEEVKVRIVLAYSNGNQFNTFKVEFLSAPISYAGNNYAAEDWLTSLEPSKALYEKTFMSFAFRYKYADNEYSAIGPYSEPAFIPTVYSYNADSGFNKSVQNNLRSMRIIDFVPSDIPSDVKSVDIIIKDHFTTNAYVVKTVNKDSQEWNTLGTGINRGDITIKSEVKGTTIPSLQLDRIYDAVPTKAKAQAFTASRLMYGNYTEGYNMEDSNNSPIDFSSNTKFETSDNVNLYSYTVSTSSDNDLFTSCNPFFDDFLNLSQNFINNTLENGVDPDVLSSQSYGVTGNADGFYCEEDLRYDPVIGQISPNLAPKMARFLIPIIPKNENGGNSSTHSFPGMIDGGAVADQGESGNYQDYGLPNPFNGGNLTEMGVMYNSLHVQNYEEFTPFIYKVPTTGSYTIEVKTKAFARRLNPRQVNPYGGGFFIDTDFDGGGFARAMPMRLELHKINASTGASEGIITDSVNISNPNSSSPYAGYAVSSKVTESMYMFGSTNGFVLRKKGYESLIDIRQGNTFEFASAADNLPELHLNREIPVGPNNDIGVGDHIGVFFVFQTSEWGNPNIPTTLNTYGQYDADTGTVDFITWDSNLDPIVEFGLDANETTMDIIAPQTVSNSSTDVQVFQPSKSVRSNRSYELGVTYLDRYGRESTVMVSQDSTVEIPKEYSDKKNVLIGNVNSNAPKWATHYKYYIKEPTTRSYNLVMHKAYPNEDVGGSGVFYAWLSFNSNDIDKIKVDDYLLAKKQHGNNSKVDSDQARYKVLDISSEAPTTNQDVDAGASPILPATGDDTSGKFFVKVEYANLRPHIINANDDAAFFAESTDTSNVSLGAVFEIEPKTAREQGVFWEASKAYPIKLNKENAHQYISVGDTIRIDSVTNIFTGDLVALAATENWNEANESITVASITGATCFPNSYNLNFTNDKELCTIQLSSNATVFGSMSNTANQVNIRFIKPDGSYVTGRAVYMASNVIKIIPYTHPTAGNYNFKPINKIALPWYNCYQFYNGVESDTIGDVFEGDTIYPYTSTGKTSGFNASAFLADYGEDEKKHDIIYSQIYNVFTSRTDDEGQSSSNINKTNEFILTDKITKRLNSDHGQINALIARNNDVIAFCEDKVLKILSSGKDALFNADGNVQLTASNRVLGQSIPFVGDFGCQHPESIAIDDYRVYFTDQARGSVLRLSRDGMTQVSSEGMSDWFNDQLERADSIVGSFDDKKGEYNLTIHETINPNVKKNVYTLSFNERDKGWTSFKSFIQESGLSLNNRYYTFKKGRAYVHHSEEALRNNFYGTQYNSTVTSLINMQPSIIKSFNVINYEGSQAEVVKVTDDDRFDNINEISGWSVEEIKTDMKEGVVEEFIEKEGKWFNSIKGKQE